MSFGSISKKSLAHPHVATNVMLKFQKDLTVVFAPTRKRDAGQNPGATKIPLPLRAGDKNGSHLKKFEPFCFYHYFSIL